MERASLLNAIGMVAVLAFFGCGSSSGSPAVAGGADASVEASAPGQGSGPQAPASCPVVVKAADCDQNQRPIVFVHGTYSSGTDISHMASLLGSNGFCQDRIVAIDYDSVAVSAGFTGGGVDSPGADCTAANTPSGCGMIDRAIDALLQKFPQFTQVDLAGHSQGTFHCGQYLANHASRVAHYINFSGVPSVGDVQTLSLSSLRDLFGSPHHATGTSICAFQQTEDGGTEAVVPEGGTDDGGGDGGAGAQVIDEALRGVAQQGRTLTDRIGQEGVDLGLGKVGLEADQVVGLGALAQDGRADHQPQDVETHL